MEHYKFVKIIYFVLKAYIKVEHYEFFENIKKVGHSKLRKCNSFESI